jgi:2',3'-cyclic-nucleotide 2'-phosphodiesterase/3'-nucleotidase
LRWKGSPLQPGQKLRLAVNSYRAGGSGGYAMFRGAPILWQSSEGIRDLMAAYFTERRRLPAKPDNNWRVEPEGARRTLEAEARGTR